MKRVSLTFMQRLELAEWLRSNLESLSQEKASYASAAARATKALGFTVTESTCESTAAAVNVKWPHALRGYSSQLASLESRIAALEKALL